MVFHFLGHLPAISRTVVRLWRKCIDALSFTGCTDVSTCICHKTPALARHYACVFKYCTYIICVYYHTITTTILFRLSVFLLFIWFIVSVFANLYFLVMCSSAKLSMSCLLKIFWNSSCDLLWCVSPGFVFLQSQLYPILNSLRWCSDLQAGPSDATAVPHIMFDEWAGSQFKKHTAYIWQSCAGAAIWWIWIHSDG